MVENLGNAPGCESSNQPLDIIFPKRPFGKTKIIYRLFQSKWFQQWRWLHYDQSRILAFCYTCPGSEEWENETVWNEL